MLNPAMDRECRAERASDAMEAVRELVCNTEDLSGLTGGQLAALLDIVFSEARASMPFSVLARAANSNQPKEDDG
jgi:hypothetical protein